ncbi:hypothetical protein Tsubulata_027591, partial [Turnera subulata]
IAKDNSKTKEKREEHGRSPDEKTFEPIFFCYMETAAAEEAESTKGLTPEEHGQGCKKCGEWEVRVVELEVEIKNARVENEALQLELKELMSGDSGRRNGGGEVRVGGGDDKVLAEEEEDGYFEVVAENEALRCEKRHAEGEAKVWKAKCEELERVLRSRGGEFVAQGSEKEVVDVEATCKTPGTPFGRIEPKSSPFIEGRKYVRPVRKQLSFQEEGTPQKRMAPSTPASVKPSCISVINIMDSDDESGADDVNMTREVCVSKDCALAGSLNIEVEKGSENILQRGAVANDGCEEDLDACDENSPLILTPKRKRAPNVVRSDSESEDDDIPIAKAKSMACREPVPDQSGSDIGAAVVYDVKSTVAPPRRRLMTLRECEGKVKMERTSSVKTRECRYERGIPTTGENQDSEAEDDELDSESDSMDNFIVESDMSDGNDACSELEDRSDGYDNQMEDESQGDELQPKAKLDDNDSQSGDGSDGDTNFDDILSMIQRSKDRRFKWNNEAEMLADFGKYHELCMKAVCALFRQQTEEEQARKITLNKNSRGFSHCDAERGSNLALLLTEGDPWSDPKKSIEELHPKAVELCRTLATRYSRQLFDIFKNKEDPFFQ